MMDVIIVDDEAAGRRTLREYCEAENDLRVVGEFGDGAAAWPPFARRRRNSCSWISKWTH